MMKAMERKNVAIIAVYRAHKKQMSQKFRFVGAELCVGLTKEACLGS